MANILHEFMDRCSSGVTLANADLIDTKSMQGKPHASRCIANLVKLKRTGAPGTMRLATALFQLQFAIREEPSHSRWIGFQCLDVCRRPPPGLRQGWRSHAFRDFWGTAATVLLPWASSAFIGITCARSTPQQMNWQCDVPKNNLTEDMKEVLAEKGSEFRNHYCIVSTTSQVMCTLTQTRIRAFPITAAELRQRWRWT